MTLRDYAMVMVPLVPAAAGFMSTTDVKGNTSQQNKR